MNAIWLIIGIFSTVVQVPAQDKGALGDFTKSPTEGIIVELTQPFVVGSVRGIITRDQDPEPLPDVLIEIRGPSSDKTIMRATTDKYGRFKIRDVAEGTYRFKTTLNGFQSVMGTITVSKRASKQKKIKIGMPLGV